MFRILALIKKDILLLLRDKAGLAVLFLMPTALILVISLVHDSALKSIHAPDIHVMILNYDPDFPLEYLTNNLQSAGSFKCHTLNKTGTFSTAHARQILDQEEYKVCLVIPEEISPYMEAFRAGISEGAMPESTDDDPTLKIIIDPAMPFMIRSSILNALNLILVTMEKNELLHYMDEMNSMNEIPVAEPPPIKKRENEHSFVMIEEIQTMEEHAHILPTATQQNVPAWTMFAMFFIAIPLSGQLITERKSGVLRRVLATPTGYTHVLTARVFVFVVVCLLQFTLMMLTGFFILPLLGVPKLVIGTAYFSLLIIALTASLAATGFGILLGTLAESHQQASMFGAVSIVIAAALGGVMVPVFVMPPLMQTVSNYSPLAWGLNAFLEVFLRNGNIEAIRGDVLKLSLFFVATVSISLLYRTFKRN